MGSWRGAPESLAKVSKFGDFGAILGPEVARGRPGGPRGGLNGANSEQIMCAAN